jgi:heme/copper-type cytochrome/quinol oxidase subunit 3
MMTAPATATRRREIDAQVGLVIFLGATAMLFAALLLAYAIVRSEAPSWPPAGAPPFPRGAAAANTLALVAASLALRHGRARAAFAFGAAFLVAQTLLWRHLVAIHLGPSAGVWGEVFFALSVLHALHVFAGLVALALTGARRLRLLTIYWDFVLVIWAVVYVAVCLL